jgi:hypothetical protein
MQPDLTPAAQRRRQGGEAFRWAGCRSLYWSLSHLLSIADNDTCLREGVFTLTEPFQTADCTDVADR